jgi:hypothetical protein
VRIVIGAVVFVGMCVLFGFIGASANPNEPGLAGSRMARTVGAPLALLIIAAFEVGVWLWSTRRSGGDDDSQRP